MFVDTSLSNSKKLDVLPASQRAFGSASVAFKSRESKTRLDRLYQTGCAKIRLPKSYDAFAEAVLINTSGGITGGDRIEWNVSLSENTNAVITTQASERAYKATSGVAKVEARIDVAAGSTCHWLPQETILFDQSALSRSLEINLAEGANLIALEAVMLGRAAMGESIENCLFKDRWRIRKNGKLIFADDIKLDGTIADIERSTALLNGNKCFATLIYVGNDDDDQLNKLVGQLRKKTSSGQMEFSAFGGKMIARFAAQDTYELRKILIPVLKQLRAADVPKVWRL